MLVFSAAVYCLHQQYPGQYQTSVTGTAADAIFQNCPYVSAPTPGMEKIEIENQLIHESGTRPVHYLQSYTDYLGKALGIDLKLTVHRPILWIRPDEEKIVPLQRYWLLNAGYKSCYTVKHYPYWQAVVDKLRGEVDFIQVGGQNHIHKPLANVVNLVGRTTTRQLIVMAYHSTGGLGPVSFLHHVYAALPKPYVCLASGLECPSWEAYPSSIYLTRAAAFPCSAHGTGCWKARTVPLGDGDEKDKSLCQLPVFVPEAAPACMAAIEPEAVVSAIRTVSNFQ